MISVIIPTINSEKHICKLLSLLHTQTIQTEIIVIDSSSSDKTIEIAQSLGVKTILIDARDFDHGGTRNLAARRACGDIIVFLTQDVLPVDEFSLERLTIPFAQDDKIGITYGRQLPHPDATPFACHMRLFNYSEDSYIADSQSCQKYGIKTSFLSNSFAAYRRKALEEIGWFREKIIMGEDMYAGAMMLLAGYKIAYVAGAMVYHSHDYSVWQEFKRYFDIGVFHRTEQWLRQKFGRAEGEGLRYMSSGLRFLATKRKAHLIPEFVLRALMKYLGYKMGYHYEKLPKSIIPTLSMHYRWWHNS